MGHINTFKLFIGVCTTTLLVSACGSSTQESSPYRPPVNSLDPQNYGNCTQNPNDGLSTNFKNIDMSFQPSGYFHKTLILDQLDRFLSASSVSIASSLKQQGVSVYRIIEDSSSTCQYFSFLDAPSKKAQDNWNSQTNMGQFSTLLGLFTTYFSRSPVTGDVWLTEPVIMLRHDTKKWTLLHEMTHYLFAQGRAQQKNMAFDDELLLELESTAKRIHTMEQQYSIEPSNELATKIVQAFSQFQTLDHQLDARQQLEEFAIESMLVDRVHENLISNIDVTPNLRNAYNYMKANSQDVVRRYKSFSQKLKNRKMNLLSQASTEVHQQIDNLIKISDNRVNFINEKLTNVFLAHNNPILFNPITADVDLRKTDHKWRHHIDESVVKTQSEIFKNL